MNADARGNPGRMVLKNQPRLKLSDLLRRRRLTLKQMMAEHGITTYASLSIRCQRMGVTPPDENDFHALVGVPTIAPPVVSNPQEGVVVLEPPPVISEQTGRKIDIEQAVEVFESDPSIDQVFEPGIELSERSQKKLRRKKESQPGG
jgi:hypothetical protein